MKKPSPNMPCPCGSGKKYKKCCQPYHKGARPADALLLMKSRYSAYAVGESRYIINTTYPDNPDYTENTDRWMEAIETFSKEREFRRLEIIEFIDGEMESFVTFRAIFDAGEMVERSRFVYEEGRWFYYSGEFLNSSIA